MNDKHNLGGQAKIQKSTTAQLHYNTRFIRFEPV